MKVLIALDESSISTRAAGVATRLFAAADPEFLVINVARVPAPWVAADMGFGSVSPMVLDPRWYEPTEEDDAELLARARAAGVTSPEVLTEAGDPVREICQAADEHDVDVIVVGSHEKSIWQRIFDPSVAEGVIRCSHRPVLVVSGTQSPNGD